MSAELAPARPDAALAPIGVRRGALAAVAALAAAALFWSPLLLGGALAGGDWASHHYHYFDFVRSAFRDYHSVPLYMPDAWVTPNFLGNAEAPTLGPLAWLLLLLPTDAYLKLLIVVFTAAALAGTWLLLRDLEVAPPVAAGVAAVFAFGGFFVSHVTVGHHWAMGAWLLPLLFWLTRRAVLGSDGALLAAAALDAATILGGQHQPFIWQNLLLGAFALLWALKARALFPVLRVALLLAFAAGLAAVKLVPLWAEFRDYAPTARIQGLPLASLLPTLAESGLGRGHIDPAIAYAHGSGWWEYAFYVGPLGLLALLAGCGFARGAWPLLVVGAFFLLLSVESLGVWPLLQDLPVWRSQRCPSRFLLLAIFAATVAGGLGLERLRARGASRWPRAVAAAAWLAVALVGLDLWRDSLPWQRAGVGAPIASVDHRPAPVVRERSGLRVALVSFTPNRMHYHIESKRPVRAVLPLRYGRRSAEWRVDGAEPFAAGERLAVAVPRGTTEVIVSYRPPGMRTGLALSLASVVLAGGWLAWRRRGSGR